MWTVEWGQFISMDWIKGLDQNSKKVTKFKWHLEVTRAKKIVIDNKNVSIPVNMDNSSSQKFRYQYYKHSKTEQRE